MQNVIYFVGGCVKINRNSILFHISSLYPVCVVYLANKVGGVGMWVSVFIASRFERFQETALLSQTDVCRNERHCIIFGRDYSCTL